VNAGQAAGRAKNRLAAAVAFVRDDAVPAGALARAEPNRCDVRQ